ncbi:PGR5-like protein 1A, chloroplastic [Aegilops tauschii subsp. strangulata]|uniref:PGR5-like protein 1A, chloroplastic n=2 Tax=Triticinae TaxID=1648030 RepID=A0A453MKR0_AEGTS|nr:PGR5-like protein 1A, chloroplastic [Aegilops tauschii subsp. strangulata]XP_020186857.1 PGR5-like protein 1A, chloroplastic [Aegilops tauschii subsp. strangulata]XP_044400520.1 PGR5-like protein 1A, chloroplastic [Triticum aestivum]
MAAEVVALSPASRLPSLSSRPAASSSSRAHRAARSARSPPALAVTTFALGRRRQALLLLRPRATEQQGQVQQQEEEVVDGNVLPYCSIDGKKKKTIGEMEQEFLRALQSFYYDQKAIMSNEEFDNLKEELMWEGSSVVMLSADEQRLLEASMAYIAGNPIMSDAEFDELKLRLKQDGSDIVTEGPRCSLRSRKVYSDLTVDYLKMFLLNVPATIVALGLFFFIDELTGFEVNVFQFPEPFGFIFTYFAALPLILVTAQVVTKAIINDVLILKGPCPNCGTENLSFYGTILSIESGGATNNVKCANCKTVMVYDSKTRLITLPDS